MEIFYGVNARIGENPVSCSHIILFVGSTLLHPNRKSIGIRTIRTTPTLRGANHSSRTETHIPNPLLPLDLHYSMRNVHPDEDHAWLLSFALPIVAHLPGASFRANDSTRQDAQTTLPRVKTTLPICGLYLLRNVSPGPRSPTRRRPRPQVPRHRCASALPRSRTPGAVAPRQTFALTLVHTATRVSEALAIRPFDVDLEAVSIRIRTLKRRAER